MTASTPSRFEGKTVLVTGSTQNLGYTIASAFARAGARVVIHGPTVPEAESARTRLQSELPGAVVEAAGFDLAELAQIDAAFAQLETRGLLPDILINNAAHLGLGEAGFLEQTPEFFQSVLQVNLIAAFRCAQLAAREMKKRGAGAVVNISSLAGERTIPNRSAYSVSKAALDCLTRSMAVELTPHGIRTNAICAGYVWTPRWNSLPPETVARRHRNVPSGAPTQQEEIAQTVLFLASDVSPTLTGARVVIDGGMGVQQLPPDIYL